MGYSFRLAARVLLYAPSHRQDSTYHGLCYTSREALAGTINSSMDPPQRIDLTTHRTMSECFYHRATTCAALMVLDEKGRGMCYPVGWMMHIKEPLLLIRKSNLCGGSGFPLSLSEWSFTICLTPYNRKYNVLSTSFFSWSKEYQTMRRCTNPPYDVKW